MILDFVGFFKIKPPIPHFPVSMPTSLGYGRLLLTFLYLKGKERDSWEMHWFTFQMLSVVRVGPGWRQEPGLQSVFCADARALPVLHVYFSRERAELAPTLGAPVGQAAA